MKTSLQKLVAQGLHNSEIARELGVHPSTITRRLRHQGIINPPTRTDLTTRRTRIHRMHQSGFTANEIAESQGVSRQVVYRDLRLITEPNKSSAKPGQNDIPA
jgi:DNA-binding NarL/FixJ family response regulator